MAGPLDGASPPSTPPTNPASGQATGGSKAAPAKAPTGKGVAPATTNTAAKKPTAGNLGNLNRAVRYDLDRLKYYFEQFDHTNGGVKDLFIAANRTMLARKKLYSDVEADLRARVTGTFASLEDSGKRLTDLVGDAGVDGNGELKDAVDVAVLDLKAEKKISNIKARAAALIKAITSGPLMEMEINGVASDLTTPSDRLMELDRKYPSYNDAFKHEVQIDPGYWKIIKDAAGACYQKSSNDEILSDIRETLAYIAEQDIRKDFIDAVKDYAINKNKIDVLNKLRPLWMSVMREKP